ncbi:aminopeptidase P family protein [Bacillaceae bacterium SIJ1]|uniref:M24 family metallopeptidase n=1 Tax=Litoribacterium kuwaitense TaxID=1398745 RepID=UPI0013EB5ADA|nr:aminopeptidase P family protein [Litoribacterium kuwaitense]NGP43594.1 aminopeptidase P family protein [Litoribacterium kuwaitense]
MSRLAKLQNALKQHSIEAMVITNPSNRRYISHFTGTAGVVFVTQNEGMLLTDFRYTEQARAQVSELEIIQYQSTLHDEVAKKAKALGVKEVAFEKTYLTYQQFEQYRQALSDISFVGVAGVIEPLRRQKEADEIRILEEAGQIADAAFEHILTVLRPGVSELEISNELEFFMRKQGADSSSFDTIVASGKRSALPHGVASDKIIEQGDMVTLDFGAYYQGYCSDITRTIAIGEPNEKLKDIHHIVLTAQKAALSAIRPGETTASVDDVARSIIAEAGYGAAFGHSTGHGIGLEVHEGPSLSGKSQEVLAPGMVVTVEPGIYVPDLGGVRIEDDVLVTEDGGRRLTHSNKELIVL